MIQATNSNRPGTDSDLILLFYHQNVGYIVVEWLALPASCVEFACSTYACEGFLQVLLFQPQKSMFRAFGDSKFTP